MRMLIFGLAAVLTLVGAREAYALDTVEQCVAEVAKAHGWSPEDLSKLQPQPITIRGRPLEIRLGGTLSMACAEALAHEAIVETVRLQGVNRALLSDKARLVNLNTRLVREKKHLTLKLERAQGAEWFEKYPWSRYLPLTTIAAVIFSIGVLIAHVWGRQITDWHARVWTKRRAKSRIESLSPS